MNQASPESSEFVPYRTDPPFRKIVETADFGVGVIDRKGRYIFANNKWAEMTGYSLNEIQSLHVADITLPEDLESSRAPARDLFSGLIPSYIIEKRIRKKDGSTFWGRIVATPILDDKGEVEAINGLIADISTLRTALERIETDASLHRLMARVNALLSLPGNPTPFIENFTQAMVAHSPFLHCAVITDFQEPIHASSAPHAGAFPDQGRLLPLVDKVRAGKTSFVSEFEYPKKSHLLMAAIPITRMGHFWGVLLLSAKNPDLFSPSSFPQIEAFARTLSGSLESQSLLGINNALYQISRLIGSRPTPQKLFDETCRILVKWGGLLDASIFLHDPSTDCLVPEVIHGNMQKVGRIPKGLRFSLSPGHPDALTGMVRAFSSGVPVINQDFTENFKKPEFKRLRHWSNRYLWRSGASFPLFGAPPPETIRFPSLPGPIIGLLTVTSAETGFFHDRLVILLEEASRNLALALALHKEDEERRESREKLSKMTELYAALNGVNRLVNQRPDEQSLLNETCRIINEIGMFYLVRILIVDEESGLLRPVAVRARNEGMVSFFQDLSFKTDAETIEKLERLSPHSCLSKKRPVIHHNLVKELGSMGLETLSTKAMEYGLWSQGSFPLYRDGQARYILSVFAERVGFFDTDFVSLLEEISKTVSHALDNIDRDREKRLAEETLKNSEEKYRLLMEEAGDGILITELETGQVIDANRQAAYLFGLRKRDLIGQAKEALLPESTRYRQDHQHLQPSSSQQETHSTHPFRYHLEGRSDSIREVEVIESRINWSSRPLLQIRLRDITDLHFYENELKRMAQQDALTGLLNRRALHAEMERLLSSHADGDRLALFYIDLDNFKSINDTYGHDTGDFLLIKTAQRIREAVRENDLIARIGGDEFLVFAPQTLSRKSIEGIAQRIIASLQDPFCINGHSLSIKASVGISVFPDHASNIGELIRNADSALYRSKRAGRNRFTFHEIPTP